VRVKTLRIAAVAALGLGLAWTREHLERGPPDGVVPGPVALWVADRDGHEITGLDAELFLAARVPIRFPVELEARADGGLWVVSAPAGHPLTFHRLARLDRAGCLRARAELGVLVDLAVLEGGDALVVDRDGTGRERVRRVADDGRGIVLAWPLGAACVAGAGGRVAVGTDRGWVAVYDLARPREGPVERRWRGGALRDLAPAPGGGWWALVGEAERRVLRLDARLEVVWSAACGLRAEQLAPVPGGERVWLVDADRPRARLFGPGGRLELEPAALALAGPGGCVAEPGGGLLVVAPGAVMRLDARGDRRPGQGGFDYLVDLARVPTW
jgi:hypothetical protein